MAASPKIPMSAESLPKQRLTLVPEYSQAPKGWHVQMGDSAPGLPARMPRSSRYVAQVEWSWSPLHGRIDAYHLSLNRGRDRWVLWVSYFDQTSWRFEGTHIGASAPRAGLQDTDASMLLLQAYWADDASNANELDAFHWINEEGMLGSGHLREIERRVWDIDAVKEESAGEHTDASLNMMSPEELAAYNRMQEAINKELRRIGAVVPPNPAEDTFSPEELAEHNRTQDAIDEEMGRPRVTLRHTEPREKAPSQSSGDTTQTSSGRP